MTAILLACILLAPSAPQTEIGEPLEVVNSDGAPQNVGADGSGEAQRRWLLPALVTDGGSSPATESGAPLPDTATVVEGKASWLCDPPKYPRCTRGYPASGLYAAAGPALRVGDWRGRTVTVRSGSRSVQVRLVDWCFCGGGRVIDLYRSAFSRLGSPSRGVLPVQVSWGEGAPATLPPTSTAR